MRSFRDEEGALLELREHVPLVIQKSLELVGRNLKTEEEILDCIRLLGFEVLSHRHRTSEYAFRNPKKPENTYFTYSTGYVRVEMPVSPWAANRTKAKNWIGPATKYVLSTKRDRLLFVLRMALKTQKELYQTWKKSSSKYSSLADFLHAKRGYIKGKQFGLS